MFHVTSVFNQALDHFDTAKVSDFDFMFAGNKITLTSFSLANVTSSNF